jgi:hypothetical protein
MVKYGSPQARQPGPGLPLAIFPKTKLKPGWLIPHASWLKHFKWNTIETNLKFRLEKKNLAKLFKT